MAEREPDWYCPCGSGKKFRKCCIRKGVVSSPGFPFGIRIKGGVRYDPDTQRFVAIVHVWDNPDGQGEPKEWVASQSFTTEDAAMAYYQAELRPVLQEALAQQAKLPGVAVSHRDLLEPEP